MHNSPVINTSEKREAVWSEADHEFARDMNKAGYGMVSKMPEGYWVGTFSSKGHEQLCVGLTRAGFEWSVWYKNIDAAFRGIANLIEGEELTGFITNG